MRVSNESILASKQHESQPWPLLSTPAIAELADRGPWVCWRRCADRRSGKPTKRPFTPAGSAASSTDPRTWSSFNECWTAAYVDGRHDGIGRVLVKGEGLVGIDLDDAYASDGAIAPWANSIVQALPSYWERSPSGAGLHGWCRGTWPENRTRPFEVKHHSLYLTVTGDHLPGTPEIIERCGPGLAELWATHFRDRQRTTSNASIELPEPMPEADVQRLIRIAPQFRRVITGSYASASERDLAICRVAKLWRWPPERAWALVRAVRTDGKAERSDYADRTLSRIY